MGARGVIKITRTACNPKVGQRCSRRGTDKLGLQHPRYNRACLHPVFYRVIPRVIFHEGVVTPTCCWPRQWTLWTTSYEFNRRPFTIELHPAYFLFYSVLLRTWSIDVRISMRTMIFSSKLSSSSTNSNYSPIGFPSFNRVARKILEQLFNASIDGTRSSKG